MGNFPACCCERERKTCDEIEICDESEVQRNGNMNFGRRNFHPADYWNRDKQFKRLYEQL